MEIIRKGGSERTKGGRSVFIDKIFEQKSLNTLFLEQQECASQYPETYAHLNNIKESLDLKTLTDIFREYARKSGVDESILNIPTIDNIFLLLDMTIPNAQMAYTQSQNTIKVNVPYFDERFKDENMPDKNVEAHFLQGIIHEYSHAVGVGECIIANDVETSTSVSYLLSGVSRQYNVEETTLDGTIKTKNKSLAFRMLDEGITERLSQEILIEYLKRTEYKMPYDLKSVYENIRHEMKTEKEGYAPIRHLLMAFTNALAIEAGVPEDVVWNGMVREYFAGELYSSELIDLFNETFGSDFGRRLMNVQDGTDIRELALAFPKISVHYPETAKRWLDHLKIPYNAK